MTGERGDFVILDDPRSVDWPFAAGSKTMGLRTGSLPSLKKEYPRSVGASRILSVMKSLNGR
jgi:hypothetical protein